MSHRLIALAAVSLCVTVAACGGSSTAGGSGVTATVTSLCQHASDALHVGGDRKLASTGVMTAAMIASQESHEGAGADAAAWRSRPSGEKFAACTFAYTTPKETTPKGSPSPCPGGYMVEPAPITDMGFILAVV